MAKEPKGHFDGSWIVEAALKARFPELAYYTLCAALALAAYAGWSKVASGLKLELGLWACTVVFLIWPALASVNMIRVFFLSVTRPEIQAPKGRRKRP